MKSRRRSRESSTTLRIRARSTANGSATDTYEYDAFGRLIAGTGSTPNNYLFSGEQLDLALSLYQMRARWYRGVTGRFITRDPVEGKKCCGMSWNSYIYVKQNPVNSIDPTGRDEAEYESIVKEESWKGKLVMRATAHVIERIIDCVEVLVLMGFSSNGAFEACMEEMGGY